MLPDRIGRGREPRTRGFTIPELLVAMSLVVSVGAIALPPLAGRLRAERVKAAAVALRSLLHTARAEAAAKSANVAVVFDPPGPDSVGRGPGADGAPTIAVYLDANHNGVRRHEIAAGTERVLQAPWRFGERFPGVRWGVPENARSGLAMPGLAVGAARMVSFSPLGGSGSGRITVSGWGAVYSVVVHGGSSRIRLERLAGDNWLPV